MVYSHTSATSYPTRAKTGQSADTMFPSKTNIILCPSTSADTMFPSKTDYSLPLNKKSFFFLTPSRLHCTLFQMTFKDPSENLVKREQEGGKYTKWHSLL